MRERPYVNSAAPTNRYFAALAAEPIWPAGVVGSITHSRTLCAAIAAHSDAYLGLGIDLEPATPLDKDLHPLIGRPEERDTLALPIETPAGPLDRGRLIFTIKEAIFKAVYPINLTWFDFQDAVVDLYPSSSTFTARLAGTVPQVPDHPILNGRWVSVASHVVATLALPVPASHAKSAG